MKTSFLNPTKLKGLFLTAIVIVMALNANAQTPVFDSLKTTAKAQQKNILLYFSGSDWCAPCIRFKKNFIEQDSFKAFSKDKLFLLNVDFPRKKANKPSKDVMKENEKLADTYNSQGSFPAILLLDAKGKIIKKWTGLPQVSLDEFITALRN